ncbi:hypothetical protein FWF89_04005 [Candidatus Saccharibacteria bacterium]|nr:hypothetical protein [Candidatus Saccharibacteria bacterium]
MELETVKLKTGKIVPKVTAEAVTASLKALSDEASIAFFELVELCRNANYEIWNDADADTLKALSLLQPNGRIHEDIRAVVLASVNGKGLNMKLVSPVG